MNYINLKLALAIIVVALVPPINARAQSNCDTIATLPWVESFNSATSINCWYTNGGNWTVNTYGGSLNFNCNSWHPEWNYAISPAITLPNDYTLTASCQVNARQGLVMKTMVCTGDYTDSNNYHLLRTDTFPNVTVNMETSLASYAGQTVRLVYAIHRPTSGFASVFFYEVSIRTHNLPRIALDGPISDFTGRPVPFAVQILEGDTTSLMLTWSSTMASVSESGLNSTMTYTVAGRDTVTVVATNAYGSDTATATLDVVAFDTLDALTWSEDFNDGLNNWVRPAGSDWSWTSWFNWNPLYGHSIWSRFSNDSLDSRIVSQPIAIPSTATDALQLIYDVAGTDPTATFDYYILATQSDYADYSSYDTIYRGENQHLGSFTTRSVPLGAYAGEVIQIAFVHNPQNLYTGGQLQFAIFIDNLSIADICSPHVEIVADPRMPEDSLLTAVARLAIGSDSLLTYQWHSYMVDMGRATMNVMDDTAVSILYAASGMDILQVIATNAYGSDTAIVNVPVAICPESESLPWEEPVDSADAFMCWLQLDFDDDTASRWMSGEYAGRWALGSGVADNGSVWMISPTINIPDTVTDAVLEWDVCGVAPYNSTLDVLLSIIDRTDTLMYLHELERCQPNPSDGYVRHSIRLDPLAGENISVAFVLRRGSVYIDSISIASVSSVGPTPPPDPPAGITSIETAELTIYPNPASMTVTVETEQPSTLTLSDATGRVCGQWKVENGKTTLDISPLPAGVYFVRLSTSPTIRKLIIR